jgi:hypothetical protein
VSTKECFGFFNDSVACQNCPAIKRCRAILVSDGFDILGSFLDEVLEEEMESEVPFFPKDKISDNIDQLLNREHRLALANDAGVLEELFGTDAEPALSDQDRLEVGPPGSMVFD